MAELVFKENLKKINTWKKKGKKIVLTNGCFDLLHMGHKYLLKKSKKKFSKLIVLINSDKSVKLLKGSKRPIENEKIRKSKIDKIKTVNMSIIFNEKTPLKYIKLIKPDIIIKGSDYKNKAISGQNFIKKYGGKVEYVDFYKNYSTTNIIKKNVKNKLSSL